MKQSYLILSYLILVFSFYSCENIVVDKPLEIQLGEFSNNIDFIVKEVNQNDLDKKTEFEIIYNKDNPNIPNIEIVKKNSVEEVEENLVSSRNTPDCCGIDVVSHVNGTNGYYLEIDYHFFYRANTQFYYLRVLTYDEGILTNDDIGIVPSGGPNCYLEPDFRFNFEPINNDCEGNITVVATASSENNNGVVVCSSSNYSFYYPGNLQVCNEN